MDDRLRLIHRKSLGGAVVGAVYSGGGATLVTVSSRGALIDRRRIELLESGLPMLPHHHECQRLPADQAVALVERVRAGAEQLARASLETLAGSLAEPVMALTVRELPAMPPTIPERIADYRAQCEADSAMYRQALVEAAAARGWRVQCYSRRTLWAQAAEVLGVADPAAHFKELGRTLDRPWRKDHQEAMAAALVTLHSSR